MIDEIYVLNVTEFITVCIAGYTHRGKMDTCGIVCLVKRGGPPQGEGCTLDTGLSTLMVNLDKFTIDKKKPLQIHWKDKRLFFMG